jgi:hypothetical protein
MTIWAINNHYNRANAFDYRVANEFTGGYLVPSIAGTAVVPARSPGDFWCWWLCATGNSGHLATGVTVQVHKLGGQPSTPYKRMLGVYGTKPRERELMYQQQSDLRVQFDSDYNFDLDLDKPDGFSTNGLWQWRSSQKAWPPGLCQAVYFRGEAGRANDGPKVCQINVAGWCEAGTTERKYVTQAKGLGIKGEPQSVSVDNMRMILMPGSDIYGVMVNSESRAKLLVSGYELLP